jgi:membrane associated rhomboid family serine protease
MAPRRVRNAINSDRPVVTFALIAINAAIWGLQLLIGVQFTLAFEYAPLLTASEPWRMITAAFLHDPYSILHILFNMYSLWIFGRELEVVLGRGRYLALYMLAAFGGSVSVLLLAPDTYVVGASGAIFGLMGAYFVVIRAIGGRSGQLLGLIAINLMSGFIVPGVSWQGHVGGVATGAVVAGVYAKTRNDSDSGKRKRYMLLVFIALIAITVVGVARLGF